MPSEKLHRRERVVRRQLATLAAGFDFWLAYARYKVLLRSTLADKLRDSTRRRSWRVLDAWRAWAQVGMSFNVKLGTVT